MLCLLLFVTVKGRAVWKLGPFALCIGLPTCASPSSPAQKLVDLVSTLLGSVFSLLSGLLEFPRILHWVHILHVLAYDNSVFVHTQSKLVNIVSMLTAVVCIFCLCFSSSIKDILGFSEPEQPCHTDLSYKPGAGKLVLIVHRLTQSSYCQFKKNGTAIVVY